MRVKEPMAHRYHVVQPDRTADGFYALLDTAEQRYVAASSLRSFVIREAQRLNGFNPIDGAEETYALQVAQRDGRRNSY